MMSLYLQGYRVCYPSRQGWERALFLGSTRAGRPLSQATLLHPASWGLLRRPLGAHRASRRGPPSVRPVLGFALTCAVQAGLGPPSKVEGLVSHCLHVRRAGAHTCAVWNSVARTDAMASERPGVRGHPTERWADVMLSQPFLRAPASARWGRKFRTGLR